MLKSEYRREIDGLRALAVIAVVINHINPSWLPGGFIGVDVFFVISGFLITGIIQREIANGAFSYQDFYARRIKRILPAFYVVLCFSLLIGYLLLLPDDFVSLASSSIYSIFWMANYYFSSLDNNYFVDSNQLPLLHIWSLSVEEQFYLFWPTALIFMSTLKKSNLVKVTMMIVVVSFTLGTYAYLSNNINAAYYWLPMRAGELLIGALAALSKKDLKGNYWSLFGLLFIILSFVFIDKGMLFPGYNAIWPCIGAILILMSKTNNIVNRWLSMRLMVMVGLVSYSLYLWHWPILAYYRYLFANEDIDIDKGAIIIAVSFLFSYLTWKYVENPLRKKPVSFKQTVINYFVLPSLVIVSFSGFVIFDKGIPSRWGDAQLSDFSVLSSISIKNACHGRNVEHCRITSKEGKSSAAPILIYGDSHAGHFEEFFNDFAKDNKVEIDLNTYVSCTLGSEESKRVNGCLESYTLFEKNYHEYETIIISNRLHSPFFEWSTEAEQLAYRERFKTEVQKIASEGVHVVLLAQLPVVNKNPRKRSLLERFGVNAKVEAKAITLKVNKVLREIAAETDGVEYIDLSPLLGCDENLKQCNAFDESGINLYMDRTHINLYGNDVLFKRLNDVEYKEISKKLNSLLLTDN